MEAKQQGITLFELLLVLMVVSGITLLALNESGRRQALINMEKQKTVANALLDAMNSHYYYRCDRSDLFTQLGKSTKDQFDAMFGMGLIDIPNVSNENEIPHFFGESLSLRYINMRVTNPPNSYDGNPASVAALTLSKCNKGTTRVPVPLTSHGLLMGYYYPYVMQVALKVTAATSGGKPLRYLKEKMGATCTANAEDSCCESNDITEITNNSGYIIWVRSITSPSLGLRSGGGAGADQMSILKHQYIWSPGGTHTWLCEGGAA